MGWTARLELRYRREGDRTVAHDRHEGPLRVLQPLYPEGPGLCQHVVLHPPGGVVAGDVLDLDLHLGEGAQALLTTPGATRFYRSEGATALQQAHVRLEAGARLEWLPLETIAHPGCRARNTLALDLAPGAEALGWDLLALGLPAADEPFDRGEFLQQIALGEHWLERGRVRGDDARLLDSPLGWAGHRALATLWCVAGAPWPAARREALLEAARTHIDAQDGPAGATSAHPQVIVLRALAARTEPLLALLQAVRGAWRGLLWDLPPVPPRIWRT